MHPCAALRYRHVKERLAPTWIYTQDGGQCWAKSALRPHHGAPWDAVIPCVEDVVILEPVYSVFARWKAMLFSSIPAKSRATASHTSLRERPRPSR